VGSFWLADSSVTALIECDDTLACVYNLIRPNDFLMEFFNFFLYSLLLPLLYLSKITVYWRMYIDVHLISFFEVIRFASCHLLLTLNLEQIFIAWILCRNCSDSALKAVIEECDILHYNIRLCIVIMAACQCGSHKHVSAHTHRQPHCGCLCVCALTCLSVW